MAGLPRRRSIPRMVYPYTFYALRRRTWTIPRRWALARLIVVVPMLVVMRMVSRGGSALTGRIGRHSTAGLAVVAAASLVLAQLDEGVGRSHPQLGREGGVVGGPVGKEGHRALFRPRFPWFWHNANTTTNAVLALVKSPSAQLGRARQT